MGPELEILMMSVVVSLACAIPGVFLVLRGVSLMSDAISHAILLGIVLVFFLTKDLSSPLFILGASLAGLATVSLTEWLISTKRLKQDAAIGIVFPVFFSLGVILISKFAHHVHIDVDAVLLGELAFAPLNRWVVQGIDMGPVGLWLMGSILVLNALFLWAFYKELKIATFDAGLATVLGFSPVVIHYGLMTITSITAVGAFEAVGSVLVVALMIAPPATAFLLANTLSQMVLYTGLIGCVSAIAGYGFAFLADVSIAGAMASTCGLSFTAAFFMAPQTGLIAKLVRFREQKIGFGSYMILVQILDHEALSNAAVENTVSNMVHHMGWTRSFSNKVVQYAVQKGWLRRDGNQLFLTSLGREQAKRVMVST